MSNALTIEMIFEQLTKIAESSAILERTLQSLENMPSTDGSNEPYSPGDIAGQARAQAVADIFRCRETTNQQLIRLYEKMYDDLMYIQGVRREPARALVTEVIDGRPPMRGPRRETVTYAEHHADAPDFPDLPDIPLVPPV